MKVFIWIVGIGVLVAVAFTIFVPPPTAPTSPVMAVGPATPDVIADVMDPALDVYRNLWLTEVGWRFHNSVFILGHGGDLIRGEWLMVAPRMTGEHFIRTVDMIAYAQRTYPGRTVVVIACNPSHEILHGFPNVYYAPDSIWCVPDRGVSTTDTSHCRDKLITFMDFSFRPRWETEPTVVGNIFEFIEAK